MDARAERKAHGSLSVLPAQGKEPEKLVWVRLNTAVRAFRGLENNYLYNIVYSSTVGIIAKPNSG